MVALAGLVGECPFAEKPRQPAAGFLELSFPARPAFLSDHSGPLASRAFVPAVTVVGMQVREISSARRRAMLDAGRIRAVNVTRGEKPQR